MRVARHLVLVALLALGFASTAHAAVEVQFVEPDGYTDSNLYGGYGGKASEPALRQIKSYLERLGERYLKPNQRLDIAVLDVDLAGRYEPWHRFGYDVRILRGVTWPRITLRYSLRENGTVLASAEETVADLAYLMRPSVRHSSETLRYEKAMLRSWFRARFAELRPPAA